MKFHTFSTYMHKLENTTKRLEMIDILTDLIKESEDDEIGNVMYLASGGITAGFENVKFNIADKLMIRIIAEAYSTPDIIHEADEVEGIYNDLGDLGDVAYELDQEKVTSDITVKEAIKNMREIAQAEGSGSQDIKVKKAADLLKNLDQLSSKYAVRIILGTTRLGFTETTIIEALANFLGDRKLKKEIEKTYNIHPDIGLVAETIKKSGLEGLDDISMHPGIPVLSQKAQRASGFMEEALERMETVWAEKKFDGTRVQLHMNRNEKATTEKQADLFSEETPKYLLKTFTRNLEETTHQYPDIIEAADKQIDAESIILDGEAIGYDKETGSFLPFQETIQRKRKHGIKEAMENIPLKYYVFDILYVNGKSVIDEPLESRRKLLDKHIKKGEVLEVDDYLETKDAVELETYYQDAKEKGLEGLIAKNPKDAYQAGARSYSWIKLKTADEKLLDDSVDCVVLGYYFGKGVRTQFGIGGFLVGVYDSEHDKYVTLSKIGTGLKEDDWKKLKKLADNAKINERPSNVEMDKIFKPDVFVKPQIVVEIGADEISESPTHTAGYALRFPRLLKFRDDKSPTESTTLSEIQQMFKTQRKSKNGQN